MVDKGKLLQYYQEHKGEVIGAGIGLIFALCVLKFGIIKLLFIITCVWIGYYLGSKIYKDREYLRKTIDKVLRYFDI